MQETPRSEMFDDVYFSALGGLEETRHVFLGGNNLPKAWQGQEHFTICETGFGTGLNFLTVWTLFEETADSGSVLDFVSFEKYPLKPEEIKNHLKIWKHVFGSKLDRLCDEYPIRASGFHRIVFSPHIILTLVFDDVNEALPELEAHVNCWFLDGFTPAKNPDMWSETLFEHMNRLSAPGSSFATFTAAGFVKRGLEKAGFEVFKQKGFAHKRDMLTGVYKNGEKLPNKSSCKTVSILGGGFAGTACAHVFKKYGLNSTLYEQEERIASGASGNKTGLYNPRITALRGPESDFYVPAYAQALRQLSQFDEIEFNPCGTLHLITDEDKERRFQKAIHNWGWQDNKMQLVDPEQASAIAGIPIEQKALFLPDAGTLNPAALCKAYSREVEVTTGRTLQREEFKTDAVILACGLGIRRYAPNLPIQGVRGQVSYCAPNSMSSKLKTAICYGGYISPVIQERHVVGSTFQRWLDHTEILEEDHDANLTNLAEAVPALSGLHAKRGWASIRAASKDRFPVIGKIEEGLYCSVAHGSHGSLSSLMGAHLLADQLRGGPLCLPKRSIKALSPARFG